MPGVRTTDCTGRSADDVAAEIVSEL
jgi:hypothetical protein